MRDTVRQVALTILLTSFISLFLFSWLSPVYSNTAEELENEINQKQEELNKNKTTLSAIEARIKEISGSSYSLTEKINLLNAEITKLQTDIDTKSKEIEEKQKLLETKKEHFDMVSTQLYMETRQNSAQLFFSFSNLDDLLQNLFVKKSAISILREDIEKINGEFTSLSEIKADLDKQKKDLDDSYALVQAEKDKLQKELNAQVAAKSSLTKRINGLNAELSDLQYQLVISRQGGTHVNPESVPSGGDTWGSLAGFRESAPSGSFALFSIGAYTHRNGLSQWGAKARAEVGQNYTQILQGYYLNAPISTDATSGIKIKVKYCGSGSTCSNCINPTITEYDLETDYLYRLGEMPESFPMEALKAQAIAARTYALNATNYGANTVRGDECGQVIAGQKTGAWKAAVDVTRGLVMKRSGAVFSSQYAALNGGWVHNGVGWDTTDKSGSGDWMSRTWDTLTQTGRTGTYYWFYKTWYRSGYTVGSTVSSTSCYRYPWLSQTEMADIVNAYQVWTAKGKNDSRIVPVHDGCHSSGNPYSHTELRMLAEKPVSSISSVSVSSSNGFTTGIIFSTNAGTVSIINTKEDPEAVNRFKTVYNLRAPGYLRIPQSGFVHINIEKK
jgi:peptidoglycan hydrolase-like amidase